MDHVCQSCGGDGAVQMEDGYLPCYHCGMTGYCPPNCWLHTGEKQRGELPEYADPVLKFRIAAEKRGDRY